MGGDGGFEWICYNRKIYDKNLLSDKMLNKVLKRCKKWWCLYNLWVIPIAKL